MYVVVFRLVPQFSQLTKCAAPARLETGAGAGAGSELSRELAAVERGPDTKTREMEPEKHIYTDIHEDKTLL